MIVHQNILSYGSAHRSQYRLYPVTIRVLLGENVKTHYCVLKWPDPPQMTIAGARPTTTTICVDWHAHRKDLQRYGINALMIHRYDEITEMLETLAIAAHRRNVFISGSAHEYAPLGRDRIEALARQLGSQLIANGYHIVSGYGLEIRQIVLNGAMGTFYRKRNTRIGDRTHVRPFPLLPQDDPERAKIYDAHRHDLLSGTNATIFFCGNRVDRSTGAFERIAPGVVQESEITRKLGGHPIPIGVTGSAAQQLWQQVFASLDEYFPGIDIRSQFDILGNPNSSNDELVGAVLEILRRINLQPVR